MRKISALLVFALLVPVASFAAGDAKHPRQQNWAFDGVFGKPDKLSIQRGLQVYREVCSACHGIKRVAFRTLTDVGFSEAEVKTMAAEYTVTDGPNDDGEMFERPARASDKFPSPYPNEKAARAAQNGAYPLDLSLIIKARHDGANYVYSLLTGYKDAPADVQVGEGLHYNPYFAGGQIAMTAPLKDDAVTYQDGTQATVDQMAHDVVNFLQWASEPEMESRKRMGIRVILFLTIMTGFFYVAKKRIWKDVH
ncbi:MAG: cytochrome c1 [Alphaproteobacteria bacterium]|nr:cytochrome c1 [Alphaproteobacteria bacterium]